MKVHWTQNAIEQLIDIYEYIANDSAIYARRTIDCITERSIQIADFPNSGRIVPEYHNDNVREIIEGSYRVIYLIKEDQIDVLAVVHCARVFSSNQPKNRDDCGDEQEN